MSSCSQPDRGRVTLVRPRQFRFATVLLALLLLFASGQVAAASPTISPVLPPGGFDTIAQNTSILLRIFYGDGSFPVSDGTLIRRINKILSIAA